MTPTPGAAGGIEAGFLVLFGGLIPAKTLGPAVLAWRILTVHWPLAVAALLFGLLGIKNLRWSGDQPSVHLTSRSVHS